MSDAPFAASAATSALPPSSSLARDSNSTVRPTNTASGPSASDVTATVLTCPSPNPTPVTVSLSISAPTSASESGGHGNTHTGLRPRGTFVTAKTGPTSQQCTVQPNTQGVGSCTVPYFPDFRTFANTSGQVIDTGLAGIETVTATAAGFPAAVTKISAAVPGLQALPTHLNYVLVGSPVSGDPCGSATLDHAGVTQLHQTIVDIANAVRNATGGLIRVNDMSLVSGGTFDFENTWRPPHFGHRRGREVDLGFRGVTTGGACLNFNVTQLRNLIRQVTGVFPGVEADHYHVRVP